MGPLFDRLLLVDWSANKTPKRGADSLWIAETAIGGDPVPKTVNPATRHVAMVDIVDRLSRALDRGERVLACFDFPFGYPAGTAAVIGEGSADWRGVWARLYAEIEDRATNANNRFAVAARLNAAFDTGPGPFWGCPPTEAGPTLAPGKPRGYGARWPAERRIVEERVRRAQPCWKLAYAGSVGGQALTGIAALEGLRRHPCLAGRIAVWPFETGLGPPGRAGAVLAEVYPSLIHASLVRAAVQPGGVKDEAQVRLLATALARLDAAGRLGSLLAGPPRPLSHPEREAVEREEAWVLGVGHEARLNGALAPQSAA